MFYLSLPIEFSFLTCMLSSHIRRKNMEFFPLFLFVSQTKLIWWCFSSHLVRWGSSIADKEIIFVGRSISGRRISLCRYFLCFNYKLHHVFFVLQLNKFFFFFFGWLVEVWVVSYWITNVSFLSFFVLLSLRWI